MQVVKIEKYREDDLKIDQAIEILKARLKRENISFTSVKTAKDFCFLKLAEKEHEVFSIIYLDSQHCMIDYEEMFMGTIDAASVYPREIVKACLYKNAAACIFCHNHPSGTPVPSEADKKLTARLKQALQLVDIRVLDHLIVGRSEVNSFAESGLM